MNRSGLSVITLSLYTKLIRGKKKKKKVTITT
jgi:hypothetical protein